MRTRVESTKGTREAGVSTIPPGQRGRAFDPAELTVECDF